MPSHSSAQRHSSDRRRVGVNILNYVPNVVRPIFRNFDISNIKLTQVELFDFSIFEFIFYFYVFFLFYKHSKYIYDK